MCSACGIATCKDGTCKVRTKNVLAGNPPRRLGAVQGRSSTMSDFLYGAPFVDAPFSTPGRGGYHGGMRRGYPGARPGTNGAPPPAMMAQGSEVLPLAVRLPLAQGQYARLDEPRSPNYVRDSGPQGAYVSPSDYVKPLETHVPVAQGQYAHAAPQSQYVYPADNAKFLGALPGGMSQTQWDALSAAQREQLSRAEILASGAPAGLTQAQWQSMSAAQQTAYLQADTAQRERLTQAIASGISTTITNVFDTVRKQQELDDRERQRQHEVEMERIRQDAETARAKIAAASGTTGTNAPPPQTYTLQTLQKGPTDSGSGSGSGVLILAGLAIAGFMMFGRGER